MKLAALILLFAGLVLCACALAFAGDKKPAPQPAPVITDTLTAYLLPDSEKVKIRTLQLEYAEREAANQTMLVTVEKNKARQTAITEEIRGVALEFARSKQIDLSAWEIDAKELKFVKKKVAAK